MKNNDVMLYAIWEPPKSFWPMSQISRNSGCLRQYLQSTKEVYKQVVATDNVTIIPGIIPRIENDL